MTVYLCAEIKLCSIAVKLRLLNNFSNFFFFQGAQHQIQFYIEYGLRTITRLNVFSRKANVTLLHQRNNMRNGVGGTVLKQFLSWYAVIYDRGGVVPSPARLKRILLYRMTRSRDQSQKHTTELSCL